MKESADHFVSLPEKCIFVCHEQVLENLLSRRNPFLLYAVVFVIQIT